MSERVLTVCLLSDGIPGHVNQAHGFVDWLREAGFDLRVQVIRCTLNHKWLRPLLTAANNRCSRFDTVNRAILAAYRLSPAPDPCDLIVSAGGNTRFANAALARRWRCPNIFIGSPRKIAAHSLSALLTLEPTRGYTRNNLVLDFAPARISTATADMNIRALLLGGNGSGFEYQPEDWRQILTWAANCANEQGVRWLVAGSRRSPDYLHALCDETLHPDHVWKHCWPGVQNENNQSHTPLAELLPRVGQVACTEDSMSMLCETINLPRPLLSLRPAHAEPPAKYRQAIASFEQRGFLQRVSTDTLSGFTWPMADAAGFSNQVQASRRRVVDRLLQLIPELENYRRPGDTARS